MVEAFLLFNINKHIEKMCFVCVLILFPEVAFIATAFMLNRIKERQSGPLFSP